MPQQPKKNSPLKGKSRSPGVPRDTKAQLAKDINAAGGPWEFDKGEKPTLDKILQREIYQQKVHSEYLSTSNAKRQISNLVDSWKSGRRYQTREDWLAKVYIPLCLGGDNPIGEDSDDEVKTEKKQSPTPAPKRTTAPKLSVDSSKPKKEPTKFISVCHKATTMKQQQQADGCPKSGGVFFNNIEEARAYCDDYFVISFDAPEDNGHNWFCQSIPTVKSADGKRQYTKVRGTYTGTIDLRDFPHFFKCFVVCNGQAVFFMRPSVPGFLLKDYSKLLGKETNPCERTADETAIEMQAISGDKTRQVRSLLIEAPEGTYFNANFEDDSIPAADQKVKLSLRETDNLVKLGKREATQLFYPAHFQILVVGTTKQVQVADDVEESLEDAFEGMGVNPEPGQIGSAHEEILPDRVASSSNNAMPSTESKNIAMENDGRGTEAMMDSGDELESATVMSQTPTPAAGNNETAASPESLPCGNVFPGFIRNTEEDRKEMFKPIKTGGEERANASAQRRQKKKAKKLNEARGVIIAPESGADPNRTSFVSNLIEAADASHAKTKEAIANTAAAPPLPIDPNQCRTDSDLQQEMETESCDSVKLAGNVGTEAESSEDLAGFFDGLESRFRVEIDGIGKKLKGDFFSLEEDHVEELPCPDDDDDLISI